MQSQIGLYLLDRTMRNEYHMPIIFYNHFILADIQGASASTLTRVIHSSVFSHLIIPFDEFVSENVGPSAFIVNIL